MDRKPNSIQIWAAQIRASFLTLAILLVGIGLSLSVWQNKIAGIEKFNWLHAILLIIGVVLTHISVNLFNEFSDYRTKIDSNTVRTPFSGGSGMIQANLTNPDTVNKVAITTLLISLTIGLYFVITSNWLLIVIIFVGGISVVFYTTYLTEWLLGELCAGLALGSFVVLGAYISMNTTWQTSLAQALPLEVILVSIPPGILTSLLLLLNEFPDVEADTKGGRYNLVIWLGKKKAAYLYCFGLSLVYLSIGALALFSSISLWVLMPLFTLPLAITAGILSIKFGDNIPKLIPALGLNVITVLSTDALLAVAFFLN